ncbi:YpsA SLOG family protein [Demequina silvatica]|uniref:YpsA SLOG family protein n=1 Tax=Demequina silvatica TaxID=1638988 RepID=UPI000784237B|nr:putative molybdenum carrier protein [Demequina silvatica]
MRHLDVSRGLRLVCGGQSGVDRAALEAAAVLGIEYGGWCPAGGWAEDLPEAPGVRGLYPLLRETPSADPAERTALNVREAGAVLVIVAEGASSPGTGVTLREAERLGRPLAILPISLSHPLEGEKAARDTVARLLAEVPGTPPTLDVAGPRESEAPGIRGAARELLVALLTPFAR